MPYVKKTTKINRDGQTIIRVEKLHTSRYGSKGKCTRSSNYGKTDENTAKRNARRACMRAEDVFNANFGQGDLLCTYTFAPEYKYLYEKEKIRLFNNYMRRLQRVYEKAGIPFKWMKAIETPEKNFHIHTAFPKIDTALLPEWEYGEVHIQICDNRDVHTYGGYLRELTHIKMGNKGKYLDCKPKQYYSHSRNLILPEPEYDIISSDHWTNEPKAPKGYYILDNRVENWNDEVDGHKHQSYILVKLPDKPKRKPKYKPTAAGKGGRR